MSRVLAVGDVHTKTQIINQVLTVIDKYDQVVFVGDYADDWGKGPLETMETWRHLKSLQEVYPEKVKLVVGNHDFAYLLNYHPSSGGFNPTTKMLLSMQENSALKYWLSKIPVTLEVDGVIYSHAGIIKDWAGGLHQDSLWSDTSPLWVRPDDGYEYDNRAQVFGHTPSKTCWEVQENVWCIDTFSTYRDGTPFGDNSVLEIIDGKEFNIRYL